MSEAQTGFILRNDILARIKEFHENGNIVDAKTHTPEHYAYTYIIKEHEEGRDAKVQLNIYYKKDGQTTISPANFSSIEFARSITSYVMENCGVGFIPDKAFFIPQMEEENFTMLIEALAEQGATVIAENKKPICKQYQIRGPQGDVVTLNRFKSGSFQVQGKGVFLKYIILDLLTEFLPYKDVIEKQLKFLNITLTADETINRLKQKMPYSFDFLQDTLKAIISPSMVLFEQKIDLTDYSVLLFPALRGLEGIIKQIFRDHGEVIGTNRHNSLSNFFVEGDDGFELVAAHKNLFKHGVIVRCLENLMTTYTKHRHNLFHVDGEIERTKIIKDRDVSEDIYTDVLNVIEDSFNRMQSTYPKRKDK